MISSDLGEAIMKPLSIDEVKAIELEIMDELDRICRENDIEYYLGYGSVLGAARHQGFIPWDDDMDVIMPREDYEKFVDNFDEWCKYSHFALSLYRDGKSIYQFAKMVDATTIVQERFIREEYQTGVWVDIFPLDRVPQNPRKVYRRNDWLMLMREFILSDTNDGTTALAKTMKKIVTPFVKNRNPTEYAKKIDENASNAPKSDSEEYVDIVAVIGKKKPMPFSLFKPVEAQFEDRKYFIPEGYDEYLTINYGDWRTPLPEKDRYLHTVSAFRLED